MSTCQHYCALGEAHKSDCPVVLKALGLPLPCYRCGKVPEVDPNGGYPTVSCSDCYDGAPDSSTRGEVGAGLNRAQAIADWNERMEQEAP